MNYKQKELQENQDHTYKNLCSKIQTNQHLDTYRYHTYICHNYTTGFVFELIIYISFNKCSCSFNFKST